MWSNFAYILILTRSRLGLLRVIFKKFTTQLWPLVIIKITYLHNILWTIWWNVIKVCILTRSRLGLLCINFRKFTVELWPLIIVKFGFHSISCEPICAIWLNFAYALTLTRSRLGLLCLNFCKFTTLMALDYHQRTNILRTNHLNLTKFCKCFDIGQL